VNASVIGALKRTGRSLAAIVMQSLPWIAAATAFGVIGTVVGYSKFGWQAADLLRSIAASAVLLACADSAFAVRPCPWQAVPSKRLVIYLLWWLPLAAILGSLQWVSLPGAWQVALALSLAAVFGWLTLIPLNKALATGSNLRRRPGQIVRASTGSLSCLVLPPAILLLLLAPVIGAMAAVGADIEFLEDAWPSEGGELSVAGILSEIVASLMPVLGAACVGFYQGALLREWALKAPQFPSTALAHERAR